MTRWVSNTNQTEAAKASLYIITMAKLEFTSGTVYVHDAVGTLTYDGNNYLGVGQFGSFDIVDENIETVARGIKVTLSGVDASLVPIVMTEVYQGRNATFYVGFLDANMQFVADPEEVWSGRMDTMSIDLGEKTAVISLSCEYRLRKEPVLARYTDEDQRLAFAGDSFFNLTQFIPRYKATWGDKPTNFGGGGGRPYDPNFRLDPF
ncbi:MAG: hypothetical protein ACO3ON_00700 [Ilumatobacteraceae bacterium]